MQNHTTGIHKTTGPDLLIKYVGHGILTKCGPACYNALDEDCHCICHGSNHSQGYDRALHNSFNHIARLKKDDPCIFLSLHSKKKLAKSLQLNILSSDA